ncbi:Flavonol 3-O-glucosyltransferase UGT89B1 [Sesamum alatum]|uniref:Flavonol 3-O-glucosyltransferase UGT89B1 n=1 Tax=Sesamum alatum TaxID=300844 RepID=A0AAE1YHH8_9LAMI|nr:Flavonol 3-O-glucosyltransferase UGT89B1 [Sesamum alatum]
MSSCRQELHVLVFPYPAQGHILPLLHLTHQLSIRGLSITILITPKNLPILNPILEANPCIQTLVLPFPSHPSIPPGVENLKDLGNHGNIPMINALSKLQGDIIQWFKSHTNPPAAILSDFFLGWTHHLADHLGIPRIAFYCSGAFYTAISDRLWGGDPQGVKPGSQMEFQDLPGAPSFTWEQAPSLFRRYREVGLGDPSFEVVKAGMAANGLSWASVFNTFQALEGEFLEHLSEKMGHPNVFSVGPLHLFDGPKESGSGEERFHLSSEVLSWLDQSDDESVLYVCFGSQKLLKKAQAEALALGLEKSGVRFIWAVRPLTAQQVADGYGSAPYGFEDRVAGRGLLTKGWAPQVSILSHRAVGGFLSHCGWNSMLEAVAAGVMILGWPMEADQYINAKLLVHYKGAAAQVCDGGDTVPDPNELAQKISESMHGNMGKRIRAKELRDKALEAVKVGGSSCNDLDKLVQELAQFNTMKSSC